MSITEEMEISPISVKEWLDTEMLSKYSVTHMMRNIIMMLISDPDSAQDELVNCIIKNKMAEQRRNDRNRSQNEAVLAEDERLEKMK